MTQSPAADRFADSDYQALAKFRHALRTFERFSEQAARNEGLTPGQHQLTLAVKGFAGEGRPTLTQISEMLQLKLHSAGELVDRAAVNGLVTKSSDPLDRRRTLVALTEKGEAHLARLTAIHRTELKRFKHEMRAILNVLDD